MNDTGLPRPLKAGLEVLSGLDLSDVRVHANSSKPAQFNALAYTQGDDIYVGTGQEKYIPHEGWHAVQQMQGRVKPNIQAKDVSINDDDELEREADEMGEKALRVTGAEQSVRVSSLQGSISFPNEGGKRSMAEVSRPNSSNIYQFRNPADHRLPVDELEALQYAGESDTAITAARGSLSAAPTVLERNIEEYISSEGLIIRPLTPRHDSTVSAPDINFFPGFNNYAGSVILPGTATHWVTGSTRGNVYIRSREHGDIDNPLPAAEVQRRLEQAVGEVAEARAGHHAGPTTWDGYRGRFDMWFDSPLFTGLDVHFDPTIATSRGPKSERSRAIFERIEAEDSSFTADYNNNVDNLRERVDSYMAPEGLNLVSSVRLQDLREAFYLYATPIATTARYNAFRAAIQTASAALIAEDRQAVSESNAWGALIASHCNTQARREEIMRIITTIPPAVGGGGAAAPPAPAPAVGAGVTPQQFLDNAYIDGPTAPIPANQRTESVILTPESPDPNPGVSVDSRITVTPAARVSGSNVSSVSPWPNASTTGVPFTPDIHNTGTITMHSQLDLLNEPGGLTPAAPATLDFDLVDDRQPFFLANWFPTMSFSSPTGFSWYTGVVNPRYFRGGQDFRVYGRLPVGSVNPGLPLSVQVSILRGGVAVIPSVTRVFPADQRTTTAYVMRIPTPAVVPVGGDPLNIEVSILAADGVTVLNMQPISVHVQPELTYSQVDAELAAGIDQTFLQGNGPAQLLGMMTTRSGMYANFAAAVNAGAITLDVATRHHDSATVVTAANSGVPDPTRKALFEGATYAAHPFRIIGLATNAYSTPNHVWLIRTSDVATGTQETPADMMDLAVHEGVHALDPRHSPIPYTNIEHYRREFRAYWMQGLFGPPNTSLCLGAPGCRDATYDPTMVAPGPKSPRARAIYEHVAGTYVFVRPAYDNNTDGFREAVDSYLHPDGINLILSTGLNDLYQHINGGITTTFAAFQTTVRSYMGVAGLLTADEQLYIRQNRLWRILVEHSVPALHQAAIKSDLGIP
ncbi:MAG: DUF4157 domain-containing protein [Desulfobulbaceae bacterium]|nr:DUF4157 domain-containing protein [Desulfobulbaceae bacterium]